jgi:dolichol-phosphate mannosyltransferase
LNIREKKLGLDTAHKFAYNYAKNKGYEKLITMDADLSHDPKEIPRFINLLDQYEFVIGSRYICGAINNQPKLRYLLSYLGNKLIKIIVLPGPWVKPSCPSVKKEKKLASTRWGG